MHLPVTVKEDEKKIENMSIISKPTKLEYNVGDTLDTTGLKLRVSYAGGKTEDVTTGFTCSPTTPQQGGYSGHNRHLRWQEHQLHRQGQQGD